MKRPIKKSAPRKPKQSKPRVEGFVDVDLNLGPALHRKMARLAARERMDLNTYIVHAVQDSLQGNTETLTRRWNAVLDALTAYCARELTAKERVALAELIERW